MLFGWAKCGKYWDWVLSKKARSHGLIWSQPFEMRLPNKVWEEGSYEGELRGWQKETISSLLFDWFGGDRICMLGFQDIMSFIGCQLTIIFIHFILSWALWKKTLDFFPGEKAHPLLFVWGDGGRLYNLTSQISHSKGKGGNTSIGRVGLSSLLPTLPETNSSWTPENVWLEDKMSLLGFRGGLLVSKNFEYSS